MKLGGDKGGSSFKMSFQIANVESPSAPENTCVFCLFEAPDTVTNLSIALERYKEEIENIQHKIWKYAQSCMLAE